MVILIIRFANDLMRLYESLSDLQMMLTELEVASLVIGLRMNIYKSKVI